MIIQVINCMTIRSFLDFLEDCWNMIQNAECNHLRSLNQNSLSITVKKIDSNNIINFIVKLKKYSIDV